MLKNRYNQQTLNNFGFLANTNKSIHHNFQQALNNTNFNTHTTLSNSHENTLLQSQPKNLSVHNLCSHTHPPPGTKNLLGLGLKFCIAYKKSQPNIKLCMKKLAYTLRNRQYMLDNSKKMTHQYIPQLYVKLKNWNPPPANQIIEDQLMTFETLLKGAITYNNKKLTSQSYHCNLTSIQQAALKELQQSKEFIILPTDKNLGPAILNYDDYVKQVLQEHLLTDSYEQLTSTLAKNRLQHTRERLIQAFKDHKQSLTDAEVKFFTRSFKNQHRVPIFYGIPKVHKTPMKLRPVVSCVNSFNSIFSTWLDYRMKQLLHLIPSYIKDSKQLISEIKLLQLPPNAKLFTADAISMYTNIDTATGIQAFRDLFTTYHHQIPTTFPRELFLTTLEIIMNNNIFTFGDTYWSQLLGTAMGTPAAPLYSIITYGYHENTAILPTFHNNLFYYKRYIDDILGIWIDTTDQQWELFKTRINQFGNLKWNIENLSKSTTFLDLKLSIQQGLLITSTYQKPMNLYLYIPPMSAHPPSCFKGFITGEVLRYWRQNTNINDFMSILSSFIQRLLQRGHNLDTLIPALQTTAALIDNRNTTTLINNNDMKEHDDATLYIHWQYHPNDIKKSTIRAIYNQTLQGIDNFHTMKIAMSRPKNLRDYLCHTRLPDMSDKNISNLLHELIRDKNNLD